MAEITQEKYPILSPFRQRIFLGIWIAQLISNIGTWMQNTAAAWMMTGLDPSPVMVALVQTASSLPIFFLGISAGAIADIVDRRRLLIVTQVWMFLSATALAFLTITGATTPFLLLLLTFSLGIGSALMMPGFQALFPELVSRRELPAAVTLNSVSFNIGRSVGPALGGLVIAIAGSGPALLLNAISFFGVIAVLIPWKPQKKTSSLPAESLSSAVRTGIRYARHATPLKAVLVHMGVFIFFGSAIWALMPLVARFGLDSGAAGYGILLGAVGVGSLIGAAIIPGIRRKVSITILITLAEIIFAAVTIALGYLQSLPLLIIAMIAGGIAWIVLVSNFSVMAQTVVPSWVQARALGMYWMIFIGGMAIASYIWGCMAAVTSVQAALLMAGIGLLISLPILMRIPIKDGLTLDMAPALCWSEPNLVLEPESEARAVFVSGKYRIKPDQKQEFLTLMQDLGQLRRRDGAMDWRLIRDMEDPSLYIEVFIIESWIEHLRQHERITMADLDLERRTRAYRADGTSSTVRHFISAYPSDWNSKISGDL
ncbi:MFS transporter [Methanosphaerula subterraneus]|uniref:MFS transporter n=1 Tax=Methanosphaerula subterraneus TaxID=3350244 RepID=UPI003F83AF66